MEAMLIGRNATTTDAPLALVRVHTMSIRVSGIGLADAIAVVRRVEDYTMKQPKMVRGLGERSRVPRPTCSASC